MHFGCPFQVAESMRIIASSNNTVFPLPVGARRTSMIARGMEGYDPRTTYNLKNLYYALRRMFRCPAYHIVIAMHDFIVTFRLNSIEDTKFE